MSFPVPSPPPDATPDRRGLVSTVAQAFGGLKTFAAGVVLGARLRFSGLAPGDVAIETPPGTVSELGIADVEAVLFSDATVQTTAALDLAAGDRININVADGVATISADAPPVPPAVTLASVGGGASLVSDGEGPDMSLRSVAGSGIASVAAAGEVVTVSVPAPSLADSGAGHSLIKTALGPAMALKRLVQGAGVVLTPTAEGVEVAAAATAPVTLASVGAGASLVSGGTGPDLAIKSVGASHRLKVASEAQRVVVGLEDTGPLDCIYYGPFTYQVRYRIGTQWTEWADAGAKDHIWVLRSSTPVRAQRAGMAGYAMGLVSLNKDYKLPDPPDTDTQYRWKDGHTPPDPIVVVGLPTVAGVNWYNGSYNNWVPGNQQRIGHSLHLSSNQVRFMSAAAIAEYEASAPNGSWLAVCHHWMVY